MEKIESLTQQSTVIGGQLNNVSTHNHIILAQSLSTVVLSIGMGPMPAIVDLWGYNGQNCSSTFSVMWFVYVGCPVFSMGGTSLIRTPMGQKISEVSSVQRLKCMHEWYLGRAGKV